MADVFKIATKRKYRFNFNGRITVEDLWDLSVEQLDTIYKNMRRQQKLKDEESLLDTKSREDKDLEYSIEIVKTIVEDKLAQAKRNKKAADMRARNKRILEIMADKEDEALKGKSIEELSAMLEEPVNGDDE